MGYDTRKLTTVIALTPFWMVLAVVLTAMAPIVFCVGLVSDENFNSALNGTRDICFGWTRIFNRDYYR